LAKTTTDPTKLDVSAGFKFKFLGLTFAAKLASIAPTSDSSKGLKSYADAWEAELLLTVYPVSLSVSPGAFKPPSSPATLFSAVTSVVIDPPSIAKGKKKIIELAKAKKAGSPQTSEFAKKFREATLLLTITVVGLDSNPDGPKPLTVAKVPLV
jgi:hypothetical protein